MGTSSTSAGPPPQWRESGLGLWKVVWVVGRRERSKTEEDGPAAARVLEAERKWEDRASAAGTG